MVVNFEKLLNANKQIQFEHLDGQYYPEYESTKKMFKALYPEAVISTDVVMTTKNNNKVFETVIKDKNGQIITRGYFSKHIESDELDAFVYADQCKESELNAFKNIGLGIPKLNSFGNLDDGIVRALQFNQENGEWETREYAGFDADRLRRYFFLNISGGSIVPELKKNKDGNFTYEVQYLKNGKPLAVEKSDNWINVNETTLDKNVLNIVYENGFKQLDIGLPDLDGFVRLNNKTYTEIVNKAEELGFFIANKNRSDTEKNIQDLGEKSFTESYMDNITAQYEEEKRRKEIEQLKNDVARKMAKEESEKLQEKETQERSQQLQKEAGSISANMIKLPCGGSIVEISRGQKDQLTMLRGMLNNVKGVRVYTTMAEYAAELGIKGNQLSAQNIDDLIKKNVDELCFHLKKDPKFFNKSSFCTVKGYPVEKKESVQALNDLIINNLLTSKMGGNFKLKIDSKGKNFVMDYVHPSKEKTLEL